MTPEKDNSANCTHYLGVCGPMALNLFPSGRPLRKMMKEERRNEDEAVTRRFGISTMMTFHTIWSSEKVAPTGLPLLGASPDAHVNFSVSVVCLLIQEKAPGARLVGRGSGFHPNGPGKPSKSYKSDVLSHLVAVWGTN